MNVLCFVDRDFGAGRYSLDHPILADVLARQFPARGHAVTFWVHADTRSPGGGRQPWLASHVRLLPSCGPMPGRRLFNMLRRAWAVRRGLGTVIDADRIDVVLVRNDWVAALAGAGLLRRRRIPLVFQWSFPHPLARAANAEDRPTVARALQRLYAGVEAVLYRRVMRAADHVIAISEWMKEMLIADGLSPSKITPLPLGFDPPQMSPDLRELTRAALGVAGQPVVLYFGEMSRVRRMEFLLDVMARVLQREPAAILVMLGAGDVPGDVRFLQQYAVDLGIAAQVRFIDRVPRSEVPAYIAAADVGVSPIRPIPAFVISSPTKFIEMLGMGCPVVANDIPEQKNILTRTGAGLSVPYDVGAFADAIVSVLRDRTAAAEMGRRGRAFVREERSLSRLTDTLEAVCAGASA